MATARDIISRAHRLLGAATSGDALPEAYYQDGLDALNDMLDGWTTQRLFIVSVAEVVTSVTGSPVTIGPGMAIDITRPVKLEPGAFVRVAGVDYPLTWIERDVYNAFTLKTVTSTIPEYGYYDAAMPTGKVYLWPYSTTPLDLHLQVQVPLTEFADLATDYPLAPGYRKAIAYSLAEELAPELRELPPSVTRQAALARAAIKRTNVRVPMMSLGMSVPLNILVG
jgi:hypothetical protein